MLFRSDCVQEVIEVKEALLKFSKNIKEETSLINNVIQQNNKVHQVISSEMLFREGATEHEEVERY